MCIKNTMMRNQTIKKVLVLLLIITTASQKAEAQFPLLDIVTTLAKKVIVAIDLEVQRVQTETIELQAAQQQIENAMALDKLTAITDWLQQEKDLYAGYYQELWQIKNAISAYERISQMINREGQIASQYQQMQSAIKQDKHFTPAEVASMGNVLSGILKESVNNLDQVYLVIKSFVTQMADADRLRMIDEAGGRIDRNYSDLQLFYQRNLTLSLERAQDANDVAATKALYGLQ
jgi:hypothetical protein